MSKNLVVLYISTIIILLVVSLFLGYYALIFSLNPYFHNTSLTHLHEPVLTKEEAIEISRNTPAVQACLNRGEYVDLFAAVYINPPSVHVRLQTNNVVWLVGWRVGLRVDNDMIFLSHTIHHYIDEITGEILYQSIDPWSMTS